MIERLLAVIKQKGLSVSAVEKQLGFGNGAIKRFSTSSPSIDKIIALSNFLNISVEYILFGNENASDLSDDIRNLISFYKSLDDKDKGIILGKAETLAELAAERKAAEWTSKKRAAEQPKKVIKPSEPAADELPDDEPEELKLVIPYFDYPASAGTGLFLDETTAEELTVKATPDAYSADFAIPIDGNSMEPDFSSGDIVLVKSCPNIPEGKIGIFVLDGDVYIKEYGGDCLISHNSEYKPIMLKKHSVSICLGRVLGKAEVV